MPYNKHTIVFFINISKAWKYWKNLTGCEWQEMSNGLVLKWCMLLASSVSGNVWGRELGAPSPPPMTYIIVDIYPVNLLYITQTTLACRQYFVFARFVSKYILRFEPAATGLYLPYSVWYTKIRLWQIITDEDDFMKVKIYIALNSEMPLTHSLEIF